MAAPQLAVDGEVKQSKLPSPAGDLHADANRPARLRRSSVGWLPGPEQFSVNPPRSGVWFIRLRHQNEEEIMRNWRVTGPITVLFILAFASSVHAANDGNFTDQSRCRLSVATASGDEHRIEIWGWDHKVDSPRDAASGLPTGKRRHHPFVVFKAPDSSSPMIYNLLTQRENLASWRLDCYRPSRPGTELKLYSSVLLFNPAIAGVENDSTSETPSGLKHEVREHVSFTYSRIRWVFHQSGITVDDDWTDGDR
jgi:type VI secretion system secreted protein Hcp